MLIFFAFSASTALLTTNFCVLYADFQVQPFTTVSLALWATGRTKRQVSLSTNRAKRETGKQANPFLGVIWRRMLPLPPTVRGPKKGLACLRLDLECQTHGLEDAGCLFR